MFSFSDARALVKGFAAFPWRGTALTLRERFGEEHLALTASSLTFTTTIALVPLIAVALAIFSAFPMFSTFQSVLQKWLIESLVPDDIARQVLGSLTKFAAQASRLGALGLVMLGATALALISTIDHTLNAIWRVRRRRPLAQRVLIYWACLTLGPLLLGASLSMTSYALSASKGLVAGLPGGVGVLLDVLQYLLLAAGMAALFYHVPNTSVKWSHAWVGGFFVSTGVELAKRLLAWYLSKVPTYSVVYGTFATVPILLVWIYVSWIIVLLGAVVAAYLPSLRSGVVRRNLGTGWRFQLALETLQRLHGARSTVGKGLTVNQLAAASKVSHLGIESALGVLVDLDWVARLEIEAGQDAPRYVLLADPDSTMMQPLIDAVLLPPIDSNENFRDHSRWAALRLREVL